MASLFGGSQLQTPNQPFWNSLFSGGNQLMGQQQQGLQGLMPLGQNLSQQGMGFLGQLGQAGQQLAPFANQGYGQQQIAGLTDILNQNLMQNILPGIQSMAGMAGQMGSGRQGVLQGQAIGDLNRTLFQGAGDILQQDLLRQQNAAAQMGQQQIGGAIGGLSQLQSPFQAAFSPFAAQWSPFQAMSGMLSQQQTPQTAQGSIIGSLMPNIGFQF